MNECRGTIAKWCVAISLAAGMAAMPVRGEPVDLSLALTELRAAYAGGITQERVEVAVRRLTRGGASTGSVWREQYVVRIDPGTTREPKRAACRITLGDLQVWWCAAGLDLPLVAPATEPAKAKPNLIAVHEMNSLTYFLATIEGMPTPTRFDVALMPVPVPQLALAFAEERTVGASMQGLTAYTPDITWESASTDDRKAPGDVVIVGRTNPAPAPADATEAPKPGKATLVTDTRTGRLKRFTAEIDDGRLELEIRIRPEPALPRPLWAIKPGVRTRVNTLMELGPKPGDATASGLVPSMLLQTVQGQIWEHLDVLKAAGAPGAVANDRLVMVFVREAVVVTRQGEPGPSEREVSVPDVSTFENADARTGLEVLGTIVKRGTAGKNARPDTPAPQGPEAGTRRPILEQVVLVATALDGMTREKVSRGAKAWGNGIVWSGSAASTIERFAPGAQAVMVVVKGSQTLCGVIRLDGRKDDAKGIEAELEAALMCPRVITKDNEPAPTKPK